MIVICLLSSSLKDDGLKCYFALPEKGIDKYEDLIYSFLNNFKYNIQEKYQFIDLCKIKQLHNQSVIDFVQMWKKDVNKLLVPEQDLKENFMVALLAHFRLEVIDLDNIYLGKLIARLHKKKSCIIQNYKELQKVTSSKSNTHANKK